ncbi:MAG: cold shock domain-containing protein [Smithellaceae bacterium]|nr:cold shock domain-containing protein [Smithellaceae bacterium]
MEKGKIVWFSERIKAGFIRTDDGRDVFFNMSAIPDGDLAVAYEGTRVGFDLRRSRNGLLAANVRELEL